MARPKFVKKASNRSRPYTRSASSKAQRKSRSSPRPNRSSSEFSGFPGPGPNTHKEDDSDAGSIVSTDDDRDEPTAGPMHDSDDDDDDDSDDDNNGHMNASACKTQEPFSQGPGPGPAEAPRHSPPPNQQHGPPGPWPSPFKRHPELQNLSCAEALRTIDLDQSLLEGGLQKYEPGFIDHHSVDLRRKMEAIIGSVEDVIKTLEKALEERKGSIDARYQQQLEGGLVRWTHHDWNLWRDLWTLRDDIAEKKLDLAKWQNRVLLMDNRAEMLGHFRERADRTIWDFGHSVEAIMDRHRL